jgi:hypothetical protein
MALAPMSNKVNKILLFFFHGNKYALCYSIFSQERVICLVITVLHDIEALIGYQRSPLK